MADFSRWTDRSRKVMQLANQEAQRFNCEWVGLEHVLVGLLKEGSGIAANVLKNLDVSIGKLRHEIESILSRVQGDGTIIMGRLPYTPAVDKMCDLAAEEAANLLHNYVGTEHILLGLTRCQPSIVQELLLSCGLTSETIRTEVLDLLSPPESGVVAHKSIEITIDGVEYVLVPKQEQ